VDKLIFEQLERFNESLSHQHKVIVCNMQTISKMLDMLIDQEQTLIKFSDHLKTIDKKIERIKR
jgi:hypothetical protein